MYHARGEIFGMNIFCTSKGFTMKARGIVIIDYDIDGGFREVADEQDKLEGAIASITKGNKRVVFHQVAMKERRGDVPPDIEKMKFRST
jgi:hypothetical protein